MRNIKKLFLAILCSLLIGCGGNGGSAAPGQSSVSVTQTEAQPTNIYPPGNPNLPGASKPQTKGALRTLIVNSSTLDISEPLQLLDNLIRRESGNEAFTQYTILNKSLTRNYQRPDFYTLKDDLASISVGYDHVIVFLPNNEPTASGESITGFTVLWTIRSDEQPVPVDDLPLSHEFGLNLGFIENGDPTGVNDLMNQLGQPFSKEQYLLPWHYSPESHQRAGWR